MKTLPRILVKSLKHYKYIETRDKQKGSISKFEKIENYKI